MKVSSKRMTIDFLSIEENIKKDYLLIAGGRKPEKIYLQKLAKSRFICCADSGVSYCRQAGIVPDYLIGDGDSAMDDWQWAEQQGVAVEKYSTDKDLTDLQLALQYIKKQKDCRSLIVSGIWGGRFDHAYSAILNLASYSKTVQYPVILADHDEVMILVKDEASINVEFTTKPFVVSLLPFSEQSIVSTSGTKWDLTKEILKKENPYAISNQLKENSKSILLNTYSGQLGLYFCFYSG